MAAGGTATHHETIRVMAEIDAVIDQHGGWPGAFQSTPVAAAS